VPEKDAEKIEKAILDYIGILGMAKSAFMPVKKQKEKLICSVKREGLNDVRAALALSGIRIEKVSGTLKGLG
jgi:RNase P/RNase MRP subunit POP5